MSVQNILEMFEKGENPIFIIPVNVNATVKSSTNWLMSQNVVAYLDASDSKKEKEYIVIGAHYDHIGVRTEGDSLQIFNGADDNASGVAGVLEIAEKLKTEKKLKYNFIFVAFGAEEMGLVGSRVFCNNPPVPLEKIKLMVNLDMIGRMDSNNQILMHTIEINEQLNTELERIKKQHPQINANLSFDSYLRGSDHASFFNKKIPSISFTTGLHKDYHKTTDTPDAINYEGGKLLLAFVYDFIRIYSVPFSAAGKDGI